MSLIRSLTNFLRPQSSMRDLEGAPESIETNPPKDSDQELIDEISQVQSTIAPHVERYMISQWADALPDAISIYAAQTSVALAELNKIVESHQQTKSLNPELDAEIFSKAEQAIDMIRHTNYKLHQRTKLMPQCSLVDMGLESAYQKGQSWLLSASKGTDYADALLWQFTNQDTSREGPGAPRGGGSRKLWPPTARTMKQTRVYLNPPGKWFKKREVEFEDCTHTLEELKETHREAAIEELEKGEMKQWESDIISRAVEKSGGTVPALNTGVSSDDASMVEEEELYALGSDDGEEEDEIVSGSSRLQGSR